MPIFRSSFFEEGELILGEYTLSSVEEDYLRGVDRQEAVRALADMGAAAVLVDNQIFSAYDKVIGKCETLPLELKDGEIVKSPGSGITWGINAAQVLQAGKRKHRREVRKVMELQGLTAHKAH
jgi:hypothetical protein